MSSLAQQVAALRAFFGTPADAQLLPAVEAMNIAMGIIGDGPLPKQVAALSGSWLCGGCRRVRG